MSLRDEPRPRLSSRCFKRIREMQSVKKYSRIIRDYANLQSASLEKDRKSEQAMSLRSSFSLFFSLRGEKNKENRISIATGLLSRQRNYLCPKNIITGDKDDNVQCKSSGLTRRNLGSQLQNQNFMQEKLCCVNDGITMVSFILSF